MAPYLGSGATYQIDILYYLRIPPPLWGAGGRSLTGKVILMEGFKESLEVHVSKDEPYFMKESEKGPPSF